MPPNFWTKKSLCISDKLPASFGSAQVLNAELKRALWITEDIVEYASKNKIFDPVAFAEETFKPDFDISTLGRQSGTPPAKTATH